MNIHKIITTFLMSVMLTSLLAMPLAFSATKVKAPAKAVMKPTVVLTPKEDVQRILRKLINDNNLNIPDAVVDASDVQDTNVVNAYTDGTKVIITSALWKKLKTEDARAFVLGHELGHITNRHIEKGLAKQVGLNVVGAVLSSVINNPVGSYGAQVGTKLLGLKFDRKQEYQADDSGVQFIMKAKYNKNAAIDVFKVLRASGSGQEVEFLVTHPLPNSRIKKLSEKYGLTPMETTVSSSKN